MVIQPNLPVSPTAPTNTSTTVTHVPQPALTQPAPTNPGTIQTPTNTSNTPNGIASPQIESDISTGVTQGARNLSGPEAEQRYDQLSNALPQLGGASQTAGSSPSAQELTQSGNTAFGQGHYAVAESSFRQALEQPGLTTEQSSSLHFNLGRCLEQQGRTQDAANEYSQFLETTPPASDSSAIHQAQQFIGRTQTETTQSQTQGADNDFRQGNYAAAESRFRQALEQTQPGTQQHSGIQYNIARCAEMQGHTQQAAQEYSQFLNTAPANTDSSALQHARQVSGNTANPPSAQQSNSRAMMAFEQGNFSEAAEQYRNALGRIPETQTESRSSIQYNLAESLSRQGNQLEASLEFRRFLETAPPGTDPQAILHAQQQIAQTQQVPF